MIEELSRKDQLPIKAFIWHAFIGDFDPNIMINILINAAFN